MGLIEGGRYDVSSSGSKAVCRASQRDEFDAGERCGPQHTKREMLSHSRHPLYVLMGWIGVARLGNPAPNLPEHGLRACLDLLCLVWCA